MKDGQHSSKEYDVIVSATQSTAHNEKHVNNKVTAIDIYLWVCFVFVIFAMIEFALSDFTTHRHLDEMSFTIRDDNSSRDDDDCILLVNRNANHKRLSAAVKESLSSHRKRNRYSPTRVSILDTVSTLSEPYDMLNEPPIETY